MISEQLYGIGARRQTPVLFNDVKSGIDPRPLVPVKRRADSKLFIEKKRQEVIDMELDDGSTQAGFEVFTV